MSRWILEAQTVRPIELRWNLMSLAILNEKKELLEEQRNTLNDIIKSLRVLAAAKARYGDEVIPSLYSAMGTRFRNEGMRHNLESIHETLADALEAAGLDPALVEAMDSTEFDDEVRQSHKEGTELVGSAVGTPVIAVNGPTGRTAFFGPVISPAPRGEAAGRLWDGVLLVAGTDGFFELKRSRNREPLFS